jgi:RimJ/RimL family protein N-acetyltransferase
MVHLRTMRAGDLPLVRRWLGAPHVATWFLAGSTLQEELEDIRQGVTGEQETEQLVVLDDGEPIGWCQWYLCAIAPDWAHDVGAGPGDAGIDYAIGEASKVGRGAGTQLVAALVQAVRSAHPRCTIVSDPDARNVASRRVLEKNGFILERVVALASEPTDDPMAIYRLAPQAAGDFRLG